MIHFLTLIHNIGQPKIGRPESGSKKITGYFSKVCRRNENDKYCHLGFYSTRSCTMFEPVCIKGVKALFIVSLVYIITMIIFSAQSDPIIIYHVMLGFFCVFDYTNVQTKTEPKTATTL